MAPYRADSARNVRAGGGVTRDPRQSLGRLGEDLACGELQRRGYVILARRYRTRHGEIDIIARDRDTVVFVEVKARRGQAYGGGGDAVTAWKQRRVARMAADFLFRRGLHDAPCRFDVVAVDFRDGPPRIVVFTHAFTD